jgi:putative transposase
VAAAYLTQGATGLRRAGRADRDRHRLPDELLKAIEGMALRRPPPHAAEVHRAAVKIAAEQGWKTPSYTVVREVIAGLDRGLLALAHHDGSVYRDTYELVGPAEPACKATQCIQADRRPLPHARPRPMQQRHP